MPIDTAESLAAKTNATVQEMYACMETAKTIHNASNKAHAATALQNTLDQMSKLILKIRAHEPTDH